MDSNSHRFDVFEGLNEPQKEAVRATEGYVRVIAGAGSGKTKTLVNRYVYLINELGISPANILCVTFTNKAAQEMKSRVAKVVTAESVGEYICTYHGFCVKVLREDITKLCYPQSFTIIDEDDQKSILKEVYEELGLTVSDFTYKFVLQCIQELKWRSIKPLGVIPPDYIAEYIDNVDEQRRVAFENFSDHLIWKCYILFLKKQKKGFYLDFTDIIAFALYILRNSEDVRDKWQKRLDYIMVDETQDNNIPQWALVEILQGYYNNLLVVGDPDQSIYGWRGAAPRALLNFDESYTPCKTVILNQNYRSTPNILGAANAVIANNDNRIEKDLYSHKPELNNVTHFHGKNEQEEGEYIAKTIISHIDQGAKLSDFAILYRASYISRFIEQALIKYKLPYIVYGGIRFFERREIKDVLSYMRMAGNGDDLSFKRTINLPSRKLGKVYIANLSEVAQRDGITLYEALTQNISSPKFDKPTAREYIRVIEEARQLSATYSISDLANHLLSETQLSEIYRKEGDEERLENIQELLDSMLRYEKDNVDEEDLGLNKYLQDIALYTNLDHKESGDNVRIMTIHQSKGLEFPIVFVAGMYESTFPSLKTIKQYRKDGLEEERRLAYVAITRAEDQLYLTESEGFNMQNRCEKFPSRFIFEIGSNFIIRDGCLTTELEEGAKRYIQSVDDTLLRDKAVLEVGEVIEHKIFGVGEVLECDVEKDSATIQFVDIAKPKHFTLTNIMGSLVTTKEDE